MIVSKRERLILVATLGVIGLALLYQYALTPLLDAREAAIARQTTLEQQVAANATLMKHRDKLSPLWKEMTTGGLKHDPTEAESQVLHALGDWAREAGVKIVALKPERSTEKRSLQEIAFQAVGTGSMKAISQFLWRIETAKIPLRIKELQLGTRKEGTDDLTIQLRLTTLYQSAATGTAAASTGTTAASTSTATATTSTGGQAASGTRDASGIRDVSSTRGTPAPSETPAPAASKTGGTL
jgi:Tfp pilus assembly protein PilO